MACARSGEAVIIPFRYSLRNLWARRLTTLLTAAGMALVVFVFTAVLMLDAGLKKTLVETGSADNAVVIRRGSESEVMSGLERDKAAIVESRPEVAIGAGGARLVSKESVVLISLMKRDTVRPANVVIRGLGPMGLELRPQARLIVGRMFRPGANEVVAGRAIAERFVGAGLGERVRFGGREWSVVGVFDAGRSAYDSEMWGDIDQLMPAFRRPVYSSMLFRLTDAEAYASLHQAIDDDPRLKLEAKRESQYYADQSAALSAFITILGLTLSVIFSIGAVIGAMITMYAAVASRTAEIGTLRALGFRRAGVLAAFLFESMLLALAGGVVGLGLAAFMQFFSVSTLNWQSFNELAFSFSLNANIIAKSLAFALAMGLVGGFLPALRAARLEIVDALRAA